MDSWEHTIIGNKVNVKLSLGLINKHNAMKTYTDNKGISPPFLSSELSGVEGLLRASPRYRISERLGGFHSGLGR
jgi:hypothetical protein